MKFQDVIMDYLSLGFSIAFHPLIHIYPGGPVCLPAEEKRLGKVSK